MESSPATIEFSDMTAIELIAVAGAFVTWLAIAAFFIWFYWKIIRAQLRMPEELAGIRAALERIADRLDQSR